VTPTPRPHQLEAIAAIQANLHTTDRVSVLMACGTGKTLVGRWLAQQRRCATTLVVVPSLALIMRFYISIMQNRDARRLQGHVG
jgi:superfamily II DNA or RNA helicase